MTWFMEKLRNIDKELLTTASLGNMQKIVKLLEKTMENGNEDNTLLHMEALMRKAGISVYDQQSLEFF